MRLLSALLLAGCLTVRGQKTEITYLSGTDKDNTVEWEFRCSSGMNSGRWTTIPVPSCWEQQGFGAYNYGHDRKPNHEQGHYRKTFSAPAAWQGRRIFITFEGVMTDADVRLNGRPAGPVHRGAFYRFQYEVTDLLRFGEDNLLEVIVDKESANESINQAERRADYWIFGGIFRPVYLEVKPQSFIERVAIDARHDGTFSMQVFPRLESQTGEVTVEAEIQTLEGKRVTKPRKGWGIGPDGAITIAGHMETPLAWTSETPHLYQAVFRLKKGRHTLHEYRQRFGFRTIEMRPGDGFYVNGVKVRFKGVCRHTFWPETGRTISPALALEDVRLIKEMNMNAVRMSHYPPDSYFLDFCDSLGLYVLDELAGWQSKYDTQTAHRLVGEMIRRDVNHPCIVIWDNGNEGGFNFEVRRDYAIWDPQHRHVVEPWSKLDGVDTHHYPKFEPSMEAVTQGGLVYMPTESLHGLHDGGHGAGLEDYWETFRQYPLYAGQFLWDFADEGVVRRDQRDSIDVENDKAPDGILGPHHEKEGSFFAIRQIWSPVYLREPVINASWDGTVSLENRYHFTTLEHYTFVCQLERYTSPLDTTVIRHNNENVPAPALSPGQSGSLRIPLPADWQSYDAIGLKALSPGGDVVCSWQWPIVSAKETAERLSATPSSTRIGLDEAIQKLKPRIVGQPMPEEPKVTWAQTADGTIRVDYQFRLKGDYDYAGIAFSYPEEGVTGATLMANGPYRVWKNRLKGTAFGVHEKAYNNTITGQDWDYPEFKGYYSGFHAVRLHSSKSADLMLYTPDEGQYLQIFTPQRPIHFSKNVEAPFPPADISVLSIIPGIGTKFSTADLEGPQGQIQHVSGQTIQGSVFLRLE
ncbi:MAG: glycoside hydrolase family 2 [Bacteroidaceae bacterium]|nr:glycoside hydrolase family 2 [Bacteroidaceae bacterium]